MPLISVILGYRNRDKERVQRCLDSLKNQTFKDFELVFTDYGSDQEYQSVIQSLVESYSFANYIFNATQGMPWNRSHALNTAIKKASGKYVLLTDIDLIFSENNLEIIANLMQPGKELFSTMHLLPEGFQKWDSLKEKPTNFENTGPRSKAAFHVVEKKVLDEIRGYDEYYCFWGVEDRDLHDRLDKVGLESEWIKEGQAPIYHQWHPIVSNKKKRFLPDRWWDDMNIYYQIQINKLQRNSDNWGHIYSKNRLTIQAANGKFGVRKMEIPALADSNKKAGIICELTNQIMQLKSEEVLAISIPNNHSEQSDSPLLTRLNRILFKSKMPLFLVKRSAFIETNKESYFDPWEDIIYAFWQLVKKEKIIKDYYIQQNEKEMLIYVQSLSSDKT